MYTVSIGGSQAKGFRSMFAFYRLTFRCYLQARKHPECVKVGLTRRGKTFFALSIWSNREGMKDYAQSGQHFDAMQQRRKIMSQFYNKSYESEAIPSIKNAITEWRADPRSYDI